MNIDNSIVVENDGATKDASLRSITMVTYGLYAASVFFGVTMIVGLIIAYIKRGDAIGTIYESHFTWLIRTFWVSLIVLVVGIPTTFIGIGILILGLGGVWFLYRVIAGFLKLNDNKAVG